VKIISYPNGAFQPGKRHDTLRNVKCACFFRKNDEESVYWGIFSYPIPLPEGLIPSKRWSLPKATSFGIFLKTTIAVHSSPFSLHEK
jgi:hypothetical protein